MNPHQAYSAIEDGSRVRLRTGPGETHAEGRAVAYSNAPMILIETDGGERIWWRADLADTFPTPPGEGGAA